MTDIQEPDPIQALRDLGYRIPEDSPGVKRAKGAFGGAVAGALTVFAPTIFYVCHTLRPDAEGFVLGSLFAAASTTGALAMGHAGKSNSRGAMLTGAFAGAAVVGTYVYTTFLPAVTQLNLLR